MDTPGTAFTWTSGFYLLAVLFLVYHTWRGWKIGLVRTGLKLAAWVGSGLVGWYGGVLAANLVGAVFPAGRVLLGVLVGVTLALVVYLALTLVSVLLFKKTTDNSSAVVRWVYGLGGAVLGFCLGLVFLWAVVTGVRAMGGIQAGRQEAQGQSPTGGWVLLKQSLEGDGVAGTLGRMDPIPSKLYETLSKFSQVTSRPDAIVRLAEYPDIADLLQHPKFVALAQDPDIQEAAAQRNVLVLMTHPKLLALATDPEIVAQVQRIDFLAALNHALQEPQDLPNRR